MNAADKVVYDSAYHSAIGLLSRREHSEYELRRKLILKDIPEPFVAKVLSVLKERDYQSDQRFTESRIRHRYLQGYGPLYVTGELRQHQISEALMALVWSVEYDWFFALNNLYQKKFAKMPRDFKAMQKCQAYLARRGFTTALIRSVVHGE